MQCELSFQHRIKGLQKSFVAACTKYIKDTNICMCKDNKNKQLNLIYHFEFPIPGLKKEL